MPAAAAPRSKTTQQGRNARPRARTAAAQRPQAARTAPLAPRRKSGPAPRRAPVAAPPPAAVARIAQGSATLLLDRLLRGRAWVALVGILLTGIVFLNVSVLELNRGIARSDAQSATLERTNSSLRSRVAGLDSTERIQRLAEARGFILPQPGDVTYLRPGGAAEARLAAARVQPPAAGTQPTSAAPSAPATVPTAASPPSAPTSSVSAPAAGTGQATPASTPPRPAPAASSSAPVTATAP